MTALSVNLNKIALLRNSRGHQAPCVIDFAKLAIAAGANGITIHPRPDQRHIRVDDVFSIKQYLASQPQIEYNIEGNPFAKPKPSNHLSDYPGLMSLIEATRPTQATLVPDSDQQLTSDHGFNLKQDGESLLPILQKLKTLGVRSSLFMDPDIEQIQLAKEIGADRIELYTEPYAQACLNGNKAETLRQYHIAAEFALGIGLKVNAGHDLNLNNLPDLLANIDISEVSIGHALTIDALLMGYEQTVKAYKTICTSLNCN